MRHVLHIPPLVIHDLHGNVVNDGKALTLSDFIKNSLSDGVFGKSMANVLAAVRIQQALLMLGNPDQPALHLEESDWKLLKEAVEKPMKPYNPNVAPSLAPFMRAVVDAEES